ncbi:hypothetical protein ACFL14_00380 [Patescibacteria group bacterium]
MFNEQNKRLWPVIKLMVRAKRNKFWIEAVSCQYYYLVWQLRLLLHYKGEVSKNEIGKSRYLSTLNKKAFNKKLLTETEYKKIDSYNEKRGRLIHNLLNRDFEYNQWEVEYRKGSDLIGMLQEKLIGKLKFGPEESYEDFLKKKLEK